MKHLYLNDEQVKQACKLHGVDFDDGNRVIHDVIPRSFGRLVRYQLCRSSLGGYYGRWVVAQDSKPSPMQPEVAESPPRPEKLGGKCGG